MTLNAVRTRRFTIGLALIGGLGVPIALMVLWQLLRWVLSNDADLFIDVMEWFESFRVMLWPSSLLMAFRSPEDLMGQISDLLFALIINIGLYALLGFATALARRHRGAEIILVVTVIGLLYSLNVFWSNHLFSFLVIAAIIVTLFVFVFRRSEIGGAAVG
jgi:hypothetical protein